MSFSEDIFASEDTFESRKDYESQDFLESQDMFGNEIPDEIEDESEKKKDGDESSNINKHSATVAGTCTHHLEIIEKLDAIMKKQEEFEKRMNLTLRFYHTIEDAVKKIERAFLYIIHQLHNLVGINEN
ncbi:uncharacterized protein LOC107981930 [Nasonia vitripennis]|uniref:Uncharacterized protein n=1 Tax=Nasonia vitripennis TaxID=7425 RepID=A0A7M7T7E4_NASVI|nr:uncharacterized protein LOC107981930 [Nasonia vitripennis]